MTDRTTERGQERQDEPDIGALRAEVAELREQVETHLRSCPAADVAQITANLRIAGIALGSGLDEAGQ